MSTPNQPSEAPPEPGATGPGATHAVVQGETAPRLAHERDQSSDSGTGPPSEVMEKAADDAEQGGVDRQRGPDAQRQYSELTQDASHKR